MLWRLFSSSCRSLPDSDSTLSLLNIYRDQQSWLMRSPTGVVSREVNRLCASGGEWTMARLNLCMQTRSLCLLGICRWHEPCFMKQCPGMTKQESQLRVADAEQGFR